MVKNDELGSRQLKANGIGKRLYATELMGHLSNTWRVKQFPGSLGWQAAVGSRQGYNSSLGKLGGYKDYWSRALKVVNCTNKAFSINQRESLSSSVNPVRIAGQVLGKVGKLQAKIDYYVLD